MAGHRSGHDVGDEFDRIRGACVFGQRVGVEVERARDRIDHDVLEDRAVAMRGIPDLGLGALRELDGLRVTAAFEVEDAVGRPAVFVVADPVSYTHLTLPTIYSV